MADIAAREPSVLEHARGFFSVAPVAVHDVFAADHDLPVLGDPHLAAGRRPDRIQPDACARPIAADQGRCLRLAVALKECDPQGLEEDSDLRIERRSARYPGLHTTAD